MLSSTGKLDELDFACLDRGNFFFSIGILAWIKYSRPVERFGRHERRLLVKIVGMGCSHHHVPMDTGY